MSEDFKIYKAENLRKINSLRRVNSGPGERDVPVLEESSILFSAAAEAHDEPRSCYNCFMFNAAEKSCAILGPDIHIEKLIWPPEPTPDSKQIEYWPVCGYWIHGSPNYGPAVHNARINPDAAGLGWVNAPKVGLSRSGSCCGGRNGGDECDYWVTEEADARDADFGFCRVLQRDTANMDCCSAFRDDDWVDWQIAQERFCERK